MTITMTARELMDKGLWIEACNIKGINEWAVNEGLMDQDATVTFTEREAQKLGLQEKKEYLNRELHEWFENIDAAIFSGDSLEYDKNAIEEAQEYVERWNRELTKRLENL